MVYVSKELPNMFRDRMWKYLTQGVTNRNYMNATKNTFLINFYEGTMPEDISSTYTLTRELGGTSTAPTSATATSNIPNKLVAQITDMSFFNLHTDGDNWVSIQVPFQLEWVADGTIGFYEFVLSGQDTTFAGSQGTSYNNVYEIHPKSAFYGSVGLLSTGADLILDSTTVVSDNMPYLYEIGFNPTITV